MLFTQLLALSLALSPNVVTAALFPENTLVKMIDHKGFKNAMKENVRMLYSPSASHLSWMGGWLIRDM